MVACRAQIYEIITTMVGRPTFERGALATSGRAREVISTHVITPHPFILHHHTTTRIVNCAQTERQKHLLPACGRTE